MMRYKNSMEFFFPFAVLIRFFFSTDQDVVCDFRDCKHISVNATVNLCISVQNQIYHLSV